MSYHVNLDKCVPGRSSAVSNQWGVQTWFCAQ